MTASRGIQKASRTLHGLTAGNPNGPPEYRVWAALIQRCENPKNPYYKNYGARGITVCHEWRVSYLAFFAYMGPRTTPKHTIERSDNNRGYEPGNCVWATRKEQNQNRRGLHLLTLNDETMTLVAWAERLGMTAAALRRRLAKLPVADALKPLPKQPRVAFKRTA